MATITVLACPVCGAPLTPETHRCAYCGSVVVISTYYPRIDTRTLNKTVIDEHIAKYRSAVRRDNNDETAHYGLGVAYFNLGLLDEAADELAQAARLMPENPHIQAQLAVVLAQAETASGRDRRAEAWDRLNRALRLDPRHVDALLLKAELLAGQGDVAGSVAAFRQAAELDPDVSRKGLSKALLLAARNDLLQERYGSAVETWGEVAKLDPDAARPLIRHFLEHYPTVLRDSGRYPTKPRRLRGPDKPWKIKRSLGIALLSAFVCLVATVVFALATPTENGSVDLSHPFGIAYSISLCSVFIVPVAVFVVMYVRRKTWIEPSEQDQVPTVDDLLHRDDVPIEHLLRAAEIVRQQLEPRSVDRGSG